MSTTQTPAAGGNAPKRRRTIVLRLSARDKTDNVAPIGELRDVLRDAGITLRILTQDPAGDEPAAEAATSAEPTASPPPRNLTLEVKVGDDIRVQLDAKAAAASAGAADPEKAAAAKRGLWELVKGVIKGGWRVTVIAALEWASKKVG